MIAIPQINRIFTMRSLTFFVGTLLLSSSLASGPAFCGYNRARNSISMILTCDQPGAVIDNILFASYGTPIVQPGSCNYAVNASCSYSQSMQLVQTACLNKNECIVVADASLPDPCPEVIKSLAITATCNNGTGSYNPIVPTCTMTSGTPPCPLPTWEPTYVINRSTICQPGNTAGYLDPVAAARWGLVSLDWSIAFGEWNSNPNGPPVLDNLTCAETLVEQARQIKAVDPTTKVFVYRNTELALSFLKPQRQIMENPDFAYYFMQYQPNNPGNVTPGTIYNENAGTPCNGCPQYFTNFSEPDAVEYFLGVSEQGEFGTSSPYVDGTFLDDSQAIPQEHPDSPHNMGLTALQLAKLQNDTYRYADLVISTLASKGKYVWQGFNNADCGDPDGVMPGPNSGDCGSVMDKICDPSWQDIPMTMQWDTNNREQTLAAFLIGRGPYAYVGYGWNGGPLPNWDSMWDMYDVGTPSNLCTQVSPGIYARNYTNGFAQLDCNTWTATLSF